VLPSAALGLPLGALTRPTPSFDNLIAAYASSRRLSKQQSLILDLYLNGKTDKEIAELCACSGATVYEHWRRMAKKSGGRQKSDLIADFHRYLRQTPPPSSRRPPLAAAEGADPSAPLAPPLTGTFGF
jgi:DNA-binding CsgD family transcriptional regulator